MDPAEIVTWSSLDLSIGMDDSQRLNLNAVPDEPHYYLQEQLVRSQTPYAGRSILGVDPAPQKNRTVNHEHIESGMPAWGDGLEIVNAAQLLQNPGQDAGAGHNEIGEPVGIRCDANCLGGFAGAHRCERRPLRISCFEDGCQSAFRTRGLFDRHYRTCHLQEAEKLNCPYPECPKVGPNGFSRMDNLLQHRRKVHGEDIPVVRERLNGKNRTRAMVKAQGAGDGQGNMN